MAAPNILNVTSITGKTAVASVTTSLSAVVTNNIADSVYKINTVIVANTDGSAAVDFSLTLTRNSTNTYIVKTVSVAADTAFTPIDKSTVIYLEEGDALSVVASDNNKLQILISYEIIS
jgi:hypothetical protein